MKELISIIKADLHRHGTRNFIKVYILEPGFKYTFYIRLAQYFSKSSFFSFVAILMKLKLFLMKRKYGIQISAKTTIGKGFFISHFGSIIVNGDCVIGDNVNISHDVTLGKANRGKNKGCPIIGNRVYIAPGAKIIGKVIIGDDVAIGANAVVTHDVPSGACVAGVPARILSMDGSEGYINNKV